MICRASTWTFRFFFSYTSLPSHHFICPSSIAVCHGTIWYSIQFYAGNSEQRIEKKMEKGKHERRFGESCPSSGLFRLLLGVPTERHFRWSVIAQQPCAARRLWQRIQAFTVRRGEENPLKLNIQSTGWAHTLDIELLTHEQTLQSIIFDCFLDWASIMLSISI